MAGRIPAARAALWTLRALRRSRRQLRRGQLDRLDLPAPPRVPESAVRGVHAVLRRRPVSCLERALLLQCWHAAHGHPHDVVIGVAGPSADFKAHAWLDDGLDEPDEEYRELSRVPAR